MPCEMDAVGEGYCELIPRAEGYRIIYRIFNGQFRKDRGLEISGKESPAADGKTLKTLGEIVVNKGMHFSLSHTHSQSSRTG